LIGRRLREGGGVAEVEEAMLREEDR
jgi:hypothetical protein